MKLSIITINYNNREGLRKTIDSVVSQTYKDYEWIVIDGGSTDGSKELIEQYQDKFSYWCSEPDKGVYNAMNKGIAKVQGDYISCMNSGDTFYDKTTLSQVFSTPHTADILYGDWLQVYSDHTQKKHFPYPVDLYSFYTKSICHQAMFVSAQLLKEKNFDESFKLLGDYSRWTEAFMADSTFEYLPLIVCKYDMMGLSSTNDDICMKEIERIRSLYPANIRELLDRLEAYEKNRTLQRAKKLLKKGGFVSFITKGTLKFFNVLFVHS